MAIKKTLELVKENIKNILGLATQVNKNKTALGTKVANVQTDGTPTVAGDSYLAKGGKLEKFVPFTPTKGVDLASQINTMSLTEKDLFKHALGLPVSDHTITRGAPDTLEHYKQVVSQGGVVKYNFHDTAHTTKDIVTDQALIAEFAGGEIVTGGAFAKFGNIKDIYIFHGIAAAVIVGTNGKNIFHGILKLNSPLTSTNAFTYDGVNIPIGSVITVSRGTLVVANKDGQENDAVILTIKGVDHTSTVDKTY